MNKNIFMSFAFLFVLAMTSCSDFLVEDPKGKLTPSTFFSSQNELDMSVYALYNKIASTEMNTNMQIPQWMGDDISANPGSNKQAYAEFDRFAPADNNKGVTNCWNSYYVVIKAANNIIMNADKTPTTTEEINIAIGQAKYWRAYSYFRLVKLWGDLPMNLDNKIDANAPVASVEKVYEQIVKDLLDCESTLPVSYSLAPRKMYGVDTYITKQASSATLSAVYMAMAGWPLNKAGHYALAAAKAKSVIDGVKAGTYGYKLEADFKNVYAPSHNYTMETVVGISYQKAFDWSERDSQLTSCNFFESIGGWGDSFGELLFWKNFPAGPRKDAIYSPKIRLKDGTLVNWWEKNSAGVNYVPENHPMFVVFAAGKDGKDYDYTQPFNDDMMNDHRHRSIRYSEVLLWYAESQARADGTPNSLAYECVNAVRNRAGLANLTAGLDGVSFANAALAEHGWEVAGYWVSMTTRRDDQMRIELLAKTFADRAANVPVEVAPGVFVTEQVTLTNKSWNPKLVYAPYPATDVSLNPNLVNK